jgi:hypothetical protein
VSAPITSGPFIGLPNPVRNEQETEHEEQTDDEHSLPRSEISKNLQESKPHDLKLCTAIHDGDGKLLPGDHHSILTVAP